MVENVELCRKAEICLNVGCRMKRIYLRSDFCRSWYTCRVSKFPNT